MGNKSSQEDQQCLLNGNEGDEEIQPVFEELKLVLIGSHGVGKNSIGNAILRKKVFTFWTVRKHVDIKETRTVSRRQIHLTRTPSWKEDWNSPEKTKNDIFQCVKSLFITRPHAVLLTLKLNSKLSELTISTLENLLTAQLWEHTIVLFTHRKKLDYTIEDYIIRQQLQPLINKCGQRYFVIQKNYSQITDTIEELIAKKNLPCCFEPNNQKKDDSIILSDLKVLVTRIKSKISSLLTYKDNCINAQNKALLDSKDKEIKRLNTIVEEKEKEIKELQSRTQDRPDLSALHRRITELEDQLKEMNHENVTLKKKIEDLTKELQVRQEEDQYATVHAGYRNKLCQDVKQESMTSNTQMQLHDLSSKGSALNNWSETLLKILEMLKDYEVKKLKYYLKDDEEFTISIDSTVDTVDLANAIKNQWDKRRAVLKIKDLIKKIPRNDDKMIQLFAPFLEEIGKTW